jgi:heme-degrading monooxygenase HmoA
MPVVSITRLRVRTWWYLPPFFVEAYRTARQAARSEGSLGVRLLRDRHRTFWTSTLWSSEASMKAFMHAAPHGPAMRKLLDWCDEAALVHWTQDSPDLPAWDEAHRRLQQDGRLSKVHYPTPEHTARIHAAPVVRSGNDLRFSR